MVLLLLLLTWRRIRKKKKKYVARNPTSPRVCEVYSYGAHSETAVSIVPRTTASEPYETAVLCGLSIMRCVVVKQ